MRVGMKQSKPPIIPRSKSDPSGQMRYANQAVREFERRIKRIRDKYIEVLRGIKRYRVTSDTNILPNRQYFFEIDSQRMDAMASDLDQFVIDQLGARDADNWFFDDFIARAYKRGVSMEYANLTQQSDLFRSQTLGARMLSESYKRRIALVRYRVFEEMKGLSADARSRLSRVLADGIANGHGIGRITDSIMKQTGVIESRARTIARTETLTAYRTARVDEAEQASIDYGLQTKMLWMSALSPTTRETHGSRHGKTYTEQEVRDFYSVDGNAINCKCSQTSVLVDVDGNPINDVLIKRMIRMKEVSDEYAT